jgi:hypothetical protein
MECSKRGGHRRNEMGLPQIGPTRIFIYGTEQNAGAGIADVLTFDEARRDCRRRRAILVLGLCLLWDEFL